MRNTFPIHPKQSLVQMLIDRKVGTLNPRLKMKCCGLVRDIDGFCQHRPDHPIYLGQYLED